MTKQMLSAIFLLTAAIVVTPAQSSADQAAKNARDRLIESKTRSAELERMKRETYNRPANDYSASRFPEIKDDFEQMQKLNDQIFQLTAEKTPLHFDTILKFVSDINHRALRLNSNLFSTEYKIKPESKNKQQPVEPQEIKLLLKTLDSSLNSFVHNSIFRNIKIVNSEDSLKAQKDLEIVIKISFEIKAKAKNVTKKDSEN